MILYALLVTVCCLAALVAFSEVREEVLEHRKPVAVLGAGHTLLWYGLLYLSPPALTGGIGFGYYGVLVILEVLAVLTVTAFVHTESRKAKIVLGVSLCSFGAMLVLYIPEIQPSRCVALVGSLETRTWTQDVQPANPAHIRLITPEVAMQVARQQLSVGGGSIGSQFEINEEDLHNQSVNGRMWWVVPLEFRGFSSWTATDGTPGFVMVSAEDPNAPPHFIRTTTLRYTPRAFFGKSLERHLWQSGYRHHVINTPVLEVDDELRPWWVVPLSARTIGMGGLVVERVLIVDPATGAIQSYALNRLPSWVDRAIPEEIVRNNFEYHGALAGGLLNALWNGHDITKPAGTESIFQYASDGQPYWVTQITSSSDSDTTMLRLVYTNARTNQSRVYLVRGGTEEAILQRVNNAVSYQNLHAKNPVFYNIRGHMTAIAPIMGASHTYQQVSLVSVMDPNMPPAIAPDIATALRRYEQLLARATSTGTPSEHTNTVTVSGTIDRFGLLSAGQETTYLFTLLNRSQRFTASTGLTPDIVLARGGDSVTVVYTPSEDPLVVVTRFTNTSISH